MHNLIFMFASNISATLLFGRQHASGGFSASLPARRKA
jgi:hypothetical protein